MGGSYGDELSGATAVAAQGAARRVDIETAITDTSDADEFSWAFQYTSVLGGKHQLTALLPLVDPDLGGLPALRNGDLALGYSYTYGEEITANPWIPSNIGTGIGLSLPTGDLADDTGSGSYIVAPRLGYVWQLNYGMALLPSLEYRRSFAAEDGAIDISAFGAALPLIYVNPRAFWVNVTPLYLRDITHATGSAGGALLVGKLFLKHLAVSLSYQLLPEFGAGDDGDIETDLLRVWNLGFHMPFSYGARS